MHATPIALPWILATLALAGTPEKPAAEVGSQRAAASAETSFRREYREALRKTEAYFKDLTASGTLTITRIPTTRARTRSTYKVLFAFNGGASKWEQTPIEVAPQDGTPVTTVWCRNPERYVLKLSRPPAGNTRFAVREILPKTLPLSDALDGTIYRHLRASYAVNGTPFSVLMDDPSFAVRSVEETREGDDRVVHVKYDYSPKRPQMLRGGELWLLPDKGWAIRECRSDYFLEDRPEATAGMTCRVEYGPLLAGVASPSRVATEQRLGKFRIEETFDYDRFIHGGARPGDFTLAHYDLAEAIPQRTPGRSGDPGSRMGWFLMANGAVVVALLLIISWRRRASGRRLTGAS